mgnify:CR=1 FL=1
MKPLTAICEVHAMLTDYATPRSLRAWGCRRKNRRLCQQMLRQLDLVKGVQHMDRCRPCRSEAAKRRGLGWRLAQALCDKVSREAILGVPES